MAWYLDSKAKKWESKGVPIFCDLLLPHPNPDDFRRTSPIPEGPYVPDNPASIASSVRTGYQMSSLEGVARAAAGQLKTLSKDPKRHCLLRHYLESIHRAATRAPALEAKAAARNLPSPKRLIWDFIDLHLKFLGQVTSMDTKAAPIQLEGIPFLCQDLPRLPKVKEEDPAT